MSRFILGPLNTALEKHRKNDRYITGETQYGRLNIHEDGGDESRVYAFILRPKPVNHPRENGDDDGRWSENFRYRSDTRGLAELLAISESSSPRIYAARDYAKRCAEWSGSFNRAVRLPPKPRKTRFVNAPLYASSTPTCLLNLAPLSPLSPRQRGCWLPSLQVKPFPVSQEARLSSSRFSSLFSPFSRITRAYRISRRVSSAIVAYRRSFLPFHLVPFSSHCATSLSLSLRSPSCAFSPSRRGDKHECKFAEPKSHRSALITPLYRVRAVFPCDTHAKRRFLSPPPCRSSSRSSPEPLVLFLSRRGNISGRRGRPTWV